MAALRDLHPAVFAHDDLFPQDTDDETWLAEAGRRGMVVLTKDARIRYRSGERRAILAAKVRCFCLNPTKGMTGPDLANALVAALPEILRLVEAADPGGFIMGVNRHGEVRPLFP